MSTVVFVHGTGVREPGFSEQFRRIRDGVREVAPAVRMVPCYWGGEFGAVLKEAGASVPHYADSRSLAPYGAEADDDGDGTALWSELYRSPVAELALAAAAGGAGGPRPETPPGAAPPAERPRALLAALTGRLARSGGDGGAGLGPGLAEAAARLAREPLLGPAAEALDDDALAWLLARAVVAATVGAALDDDAPLVPDGVARDAAVAALAEEMGGGPLGSDRGPVGAAAALLARPALRFASHQAVRRRRTLTDAVHPMAGDILLYLAHGEPVRRMLRDLVASLEPPVVLLGHSLGGIIALDTLVGTPLPQAELLVTVGSQGPFLYETGALPSLRHPDPLPDHLPAWLNIHDRRDLLGYIGAGLFPGRVRDVEVDNRQPFPAAHSAYWTNRAVYRAIAAELP